MIARADTTMYGASNSKTSTPRMLCLRLDASIRKGTWNAYDDYFVTMFPAVLSRFYILAPCAFDFDTPRFIRLPPLQRTAPWPPRGTEGPVWETLLWSIDAWNQTRTASDGRKQRCRAKWCRGSWNKKSFFAACADCCKGPMTTRYQLKI